MNEHYGASFGDDNDAIMNYFKHEMVIQCILIINRKFDIVVINYFSKA